MDPKKQTQMLKSQEFNESTNLRLALSTGDWKFETFLQILQRKIDTFLLVGEKEKEPKNLTERMEINWVMVNQ